MSRALPYTLILAALITSLAFGEVRLVTQPDVSWGPSADNTTSAGGHVGGKIPHYFSTAAWTDNLALYGKSVTGDSTGNISGFDNVTNTGYGGTLRSGDFITKGPWVDVRAYGAVADDNVDDDTALVAATTEALSTGKPLLFPAGQFDFSDQWVISSDRAARMKPLTIIGSGADAQSNTLDYVPSGGTVLNFKYAGGPKIVSKGIGSVKIRGVSLYNSGTDNNFFIYGECTKWDIDSSVSFWGNSTNRNGGIQLGGDNTATGFQGYGTKIDGAYFQKIHRALYLRAWANAVVFTNNNIWNGSGGVSAIELDPTSGQSITGAVISGNLIEMVNYTNGISASGDAGGVQGNIFNGNSFYDAASTGKIAYNMNTAGNYNTIVENMSPAGDITFIDSVGLKKNTVIRNNQTQVSSLGETYLNVYNGIGIRFLNGHGPGVFLGDNTSTWSKTEQIFDSGAQRNWRLLFFSDNGAVSYSPFEVRTYPDASWANSTTDIYSDYTFRFKAAATMEQWADTLNFKKSDGTVKGYFDANGFSINVGNLNTVTGGSTTISTGVGSVKMSTANAATNTVWIPMRYNGNTYYVPGFTTNAP